MDNAGRVRFILITGFLNTLGIGLIQPIMPALLMDITGQPAVDAAFWGGVATFSYALVQFICTPIIGALSDRYGRRPVLLVSLAAFALDMVLLGFAWSLTSLMVIRVLAGCFASTFSTANAYIADITPADERGAKFALFGAAFGLGFIFGPFLGGVLGDYNPRAPFFAAAALAGVNLIYGYFVATETLTARNRRPFEWRRANTFGAILSITRFSGTGTLLIVSFFATLSTWSFVTVWSYVAIAKFAWTGYEIGLSIAFYGLIAFLSQALLVPRLIRVWGTTATIIIATVAEAIMLAGIGFSSSAFMLIVFLSFALIASAQAPAVQQVLSSRVAQNAQGELQGGVSALNSLAIVIAPILYPGLLTYFAGTQDDPGFPGAPFVAAACLTLLALIFYLFGGQKNKEKSKT